MSELDWTELDPDLLHFIAKNQATFPISSGSEPYAGNGAQRPVCLTLRLNSLGFSRPRLTKTHTLQLPEVYRKRLSGPSKRYVIVEEVPHSNSALAIPPFLLNPLTRTQIPLPLENNLFHRPIYVEPNLDCASDNDVLGVFLLLGGFENMRSTITLSVWRSSYGSSTNVEVTRGSKGLYYKGKFYNTLDCRELLVMDVTMGDVISTIPYPKRDWCPDYLIETSDGLLRVLRIFSPFDNNSFADDCRFEVYHLEEREGGKSRWEKLDKIGDLMVFLDGTHGFCSKASDFDGFRGNCDMRGGIGMLYVGMTWRRE
ncbi:hypothetical protein LUZ60_014305 [Juncus effusus]|nr:hypothetical protein LUZ60_014305 [Juncus effusus]